MWLAKANALELLLIFCWTFIFFMEAFAGAWGMATFAGCFLCFLVLITRARIRYETKADPH